MKKILSLVLSLIIVLTTFNGMTAIASEDTSGKCGDNITWELYPNGLLHIGGSGDMYNYDGTGQAPWYSRKDEITSIIIDDEITSVGNSAFMGCKYAESVTIGNSVKTIGDDAFFRCESLVTVDVPDSVITIGNSAFSWCFALEDITLSDNLETIGDEAFYYCQSLGSFFLPDSVTSIGERVLGLCPSLGKIEVGIYNPVYYSGTNSIIETATNTLIIGCKKTYISNGVEAIGEGAFEDCNDIKELIIPSTVRVIEQKAFVGSGIESLDIRDGVETIGESAFADCYNLTKVSVPKTVKTLGNYAFSDCYGLTEVTIGSGVTEIGDYAFYNGMELTKIIIPKSVKRIGVGAFDQRSNNACDVYYEGTEEDWSNITVDEGNEFFDEYCTFHFETVQPVKVYGYMKAFGENSTATIELIKDGEVTNSGTMTGTKGDHTVENVTPGTYTLRASKPGYATREYEITVSNYDCNCGVEIMLYGDVTGEGSIGNADVLHINRYNSNKSSVFDNYTGDALAYRLKVANVTAIAGTDNIINNADVIQINRMNANLPSVFDSFI